MPDAQRLPSAGLRAHPPPAVRPRSRLRADRPAAAVPPRGVEPAPVAGRDREGPVAHPPRRAQPRRRPRLRPRRRRLPGQAARGHLDGRGGVPGRSRLGATEGGLDVVLPDPVAGQIFARIRQGKPLGDLGQNLAGTAPSEANIVVPVVDHDSAARRRRWSRSSTTPASTLSRDRRLRDVRRRREGLGHRVQGRTPERRRRSCRSTSPNLPLLEVQGEHAEGQPGGGLHHRRLRPAAGGQRRRLDRAASRRSR